MLNKIVDVFYRLYLQLADITTPSDMHLRVRLDLTPDKTNQRHIRLRVSSFEGTLVYDEIVAIMKLVTTTFEEVDIPFEVSIQNNGIEITVMGPLPDGDLTADLSPATLQDEGNANAKVWLEKGDVGTAMATGDGAYVEHLLAEMSFGSDPLVILDDGTAAMITGYEDPVKGDHGAFTQGDHGTFILVSVFGTQGQLESGTLRVPIHRICRVVTFNTDDAIHEVKKGLDAKAQHRHSTEDVLHLLVARPGEEQ